MPIIRHKKTSDTNMSEALVGATGFEPAAAWSQTRSATGLRYTPMHYSEKPFLAFAGAKVQHFSEICKFFGNYLIIFCSLKIFVSTCTPLSTCSLVCVAIRANLTSVS